MAPSLSSASFWFQQCSTSRKRGAAGLLLVCLPLASLVGGLGLGKFWAQADEGKVVGKAVDSKTEAAQKQALAQVQQLVGFWKGVGQPQRGSTKGSWVEKANWAWSFSAEGPSLIGKLSDDKYFSQWQIRPGAKPGEFSLLATVPAAEGAAPTTVTYTGKLATKGGEAAAKDKTTGDDQLELTADKPPEGVPAKISLRLVAGGDRLLVLLEKGSAASGSGFARLAEIGYTRQGSGFGQGGGGRECLVTGGAGTMEVTFGGQTFYVCCTGCRDYFNDDPAKAVAEYKSRKAAEKEAKAAAAAKAAQGE